MKEKYSTAKVLRHLKRNSSQHNRQGMQRFGIRPKTKLLGVNVPILRKLAKDIGTDHKLALELWKTKIHEARILAGMIVDKEQVTGKLMDIWMRDFDSWDICDETCLNLWYALPISYKKAKVWTSRRPEFERRAGFALMAILALKEKTGADKKFIDFFPHIRKYATDERNFVKKAVNWALRQIGKRNLRLNKLAIKEAKQIQKIDNKAARWIANDAARELQGQTVQRRLIGR
ncbi:DNA alkylation repair protein [bacterium]|nr:DNA alkylation repair protein [bacterium]